MSSNAQLEKTIITTIELAIKAAKKENSVGKNCTALYLVKDIYITLFVGSERKYTIDSLDKDDPIKAFEAILGTYFKDYELERYSGLDIESYTLYI